MAKETAGEIIIPDQATLKSNVSKAIVSAEELEIKNADDLPKATDLMIKIKTVGKMITSTKESITRPANETLKAVRAFFSPLEKQFEEAERIVKHKIIVYREKELAAAKVKEDKVMAKVESGKMTMDKAAVKLGEITPEKTVTGNTGKATYRKIKEVAVTDESLVPDEYWELDMVKIRKVAIAGVAIPGVTVTEREIVQGIGN